MGSVLSLLSTLTESYYGRKNMDRNGKEIMKEQDPHPLIIDGKLYLMSSFGKLVCMSATNGQVIWSVDLVKEYGARSITWGMTENLAFDGNVLYCSPGGVETSTVALDRNSGKLIWKSKGIDEESAYCSPIIIKTADKKILVTLMEKSVCGFNAESGILLWKFKHENTYNVHPNSPVYSDGHLFCFSESGSGGLMLKLEMNGNAVKQLWGSTLIDNINSGAVILNGRIYGTGDRNRRLFCLDMKTGKELFSIGNAAPANIIANDGLLYIYTESGKILLIEPQADRFNIISTFTVPYGSNPHWAHLVLKNKRLYVRHGNSLMVYDVGVTQN